MTPDASFNHTQAIGRHTGQQERGSSYLASYNDSRGGCVFERGELMANFNIDDTPRIMPGNAITLDTPTGPIVIKQFFLVGKVDEPSQEELDKKALLFDAAEDLYAAASNITSWMEEHGGEPPPPKILTKYIYALYKAAAKAEGRAQ